MHRSIPKVLFGLAIGLSIAAFALPAHATAILEGNNSNGFSQNFEIEIIEGDEIKNRPPLPRRARTEEANSVTWSSSRGIDVKTVIARYNRNLDAGQMNRISNSILDMSQTYNLDPKLLSSVVAVESSFNPTAISSSGAIGLGQLKPDTAKWLGVNDPYDPADNLMGVAKYLRYLLDRYNGSVQHALAAYFQGQGTIDRRGIDEGASYYIGKVNKVFNRF